MLLSRKAPACLLVVAVLASFTGPATAASIYDDAVAYWPFEGTGTTVTDESLTTPIDLDFMGTLNRVEGIVGNAYDATGGGNLLTTNGDVDALDMSRDEDFTISTWVYLQHTDTALFASKMESSGNYRGWYLSRYGTTQTLEFMVRSQNAPGYMSFVRSDDTIALNEWVHVAATFSYNFGDDLRGVRLYINGESASATRVRDLGSDPPTLDNDRSFNIFGRNDLPSVASAGLVDEMAIWNRVLSPLEIANIYMGMLIPGDANRDGTVDADDAAVLAAHWQKSTESGWWHGDFNGDGVVDDIDATIMASNWLRSVQLPGNAAVPEPGVLVLFIAGLPFAIMSLVSLLNPRHRSIDH